MILSNTLVERNPHLKLPPAPQSWPITEISTRAQRPNGQPQSNPEASVPLLTGTSNESRMLFTSPCLGEAIEDSQNEGCNI